MLKFTFIKIPVKGNRKLSYFESLGYEIIEDFLLIDIKDLNKGSRQLVDVICDFCNKEVSISYKEYLRNISIGNKYACSKTCGSEKAKETNIKNIGVEYPMMLKNIQNKAKKTNLEKYGVEYLQQSSFIKEKSKETLNNKYGVSHISKSLLFKQKFKETCLNNNGVEYPMQSEVIKEKYKETLLKNWNVDNPSKSKEIQNLVKKNNQEKYGVNHTSELKVVINKIKNTKLLKYGNENYNNIDKIKETLNSLTKEDWEIILDKRKSTNIEKYGNENYNNTDKIKETLNSFNKDDWEIILDKRKSTNIQKYGNENYNNIDKIKETLSSFTEEDWKIILDKIKNTKLLKYGNENYNNIDKIKETLNSFTEEDWKIILDKRKSTNIEKYGVDHLYKLELYRKVNFNIANDDNYLNYIDGINSLFSCDMGKCHQFEIDSDNYYHRNKNKIPLCTVCYPIGELSSISERELLAYIKSIYNSEVFENYLNGLEIDIYLPNLKIGFEFNGLYWHSELFKQKNYHLDKFNYFKDKGIRIIHIWEDDWKNKKEIIKSQILNWINGISDKIYARKCEIKEIDGKVCSSFLNENHIQGNDKSNIKIGLFHNNNLISVMTFNKMEGRKKLKDAEWNLSRFCSKLNISVVGGASKLLNFFIKKYPSKRIISYADKDWSLGDIYFKLGFLKMYDTLPDYKYIINNIRKHKQNFKKSNLKLDNMSESSYMKDNLFYKIYDCGKTKFEKII